MILWARLFQGFPRLRNIFRKMVSIEIISGTGQFFKIYIWVNIHLPWVDLIYQGKGVNKSMPHNKDKSSHQRKYSPKGLTCKMRALASSLGCGNSILRSNRPERIRAGSRMSARLVAAITYDFPKNWRSSLIWSRIDTIIITCSATFLLILIYGTKIRIWRSKIDSHKED